MVMEWLCVFDWRLHSVQRIYFLRPVSSQWVYSAVSSCCNTCWLLQSLLIVLSLLGLNRQDNKFRLPGITQDLVFTWSGHLPVLEELITGQLLCKTLTLNCWSHIELFIPWVTRWKQWAMHRFWHASMLSIFPTYLLHQVGCLFKRFCFSPSDVNQYCFLWVWTSHHLLQLQSKQLYSSFFFIVFLILIDYNQKFECSI